MVTPGVEDSSLRYLQNIEERYEHIHKCDPIFTYLHFCIPQSEITSLLRESDPKLDQRGGFSDI